MTDKEFGKLIDVKRPKVLWDNTVQSDNVSRLSGFPGRRKLWRTSTSETLGGVCIPSRNASKKGSRSSSRNFPSQDWETPLVPRTSDDGHRQIWIDWKSLAAHVVGTP